MNYRIILRFNRFGKESEREALFPRIPIIGENVLVNVTGKIGGDLTKFKVRLVEWNTSNLVVKIFLE